jgi:predicted nucleic acid-binding protein
MNDQTFSFPKRKSLIKKKRRGRKDEIVVSNTGPMRHLFEIGQVQTLTLFSDIYFPKQVKDELLAQGVWGSLESTIGGHLHVENVADSDVDAKLATFAPFKLHCADASVIFLAERLKPSAVLTDDLNLRKALESVGMTAVGSVGILIRCFKLGCFGKAELEMMLDKLFTGSTLYLSKAFKVRVKAMIDGLPEP